MLNTYMRDIIVYTWRQTEYAYKVPELLRTLVGKNITPEIESKLTEMETYVDEIGRNVYIIYFRDVVETICKAVSEMDYYYWRMRVRSIDKLIEDSVEHAEGKSTTNAMKETAYAMLELLPTSMYHKKDFSGGSKYTYLSNLYYLTRAFVKEYEPELIYYVKDSYERVLGSEICRVVDIDNCGLGRLRDTIKKRALKRSDNIYANWESVDDTEKCAAYMLQVLNDFCAELPFSGDDCCIYRNILKEAREWLPYRYVGLRA